MTNAKLERILSVVLTLAMVLSMMLVFTVSGSAAGEKTYTLDVGSLTPFANGQKYDGEYVKAGTDNYFTVIYSAKAKIDSSSKTFSDGTPGTQRIAWGDKTTVNSDEILNAVKIKTEGSAKIKIWWICGDVIKGTNDPRQVAIYSPSGSIVDITKITSDGPTEGEDGIKNDLFVSELEVSEAGIYYIGNEGGSNYFYKIEVTDHADGEPLPERADFASVSAPSFTEYTDLGDGTVSVKVDALIGHDGADELIVNMYDTNDNLIQTRASVTEKSSHTFKFSPADSGRYIFKAELIRGDSKKTSEASASVDFIYPLKAPYISSVTSAGGGTIEIIWGKVHEAESYEILQDGIVIATVGAESLNYTASGLNIGTEYSYQVVAVRGSEKLTSAANSTVATQDAKRAWGFTVYGPSAKADNNSYTGSINDDGWVRVQSLGGSGKIQHASVDGIAFYYTAIPTEYNFTLRAKITVNSWTLSNGQEGFGLMVTDRLGVNGDTSDFWNNSYLAGSTKIEYKFDSDNDEVIDIKVVDDSLKKFSMKLGIGTLAKTGVTKENLPLLEAKDTDATNKYFVSRQYTLERQAADVMSDAGSYNLIGNYTNLPAGTLEDRFLVTEYIMEITKSNTGYLISHYNLNGELVMQKQFYDPEALNHLDENFVYAGFFASRNADITFSDVKLTTILASEDEPREYPPTEYITPTISVGSGSVTTNNDYELILDPNVAGTLKVTYDGETIADDVYLKALQRYRVNIVLNRYDLNRIRIEFTPDPYQELLEFQALSSTKTIYKNHEIMFNRGNYHRKTIYISPSVEPYTTTADGTRENPFDIFTALENAYPGQTLILMEGTYKPQTTLKIQRGMDGTPDAYINLIADPDAKTRPVFDFEELYAGFTHGGDYWYFYGFDVTGSLDGKNGFQISGNYNILDQIHAYENGNTGIQITRYSGDDLMPDWPSYNLILNCTSYRNYDSGFEDADGFAAKLTVGPGNVFDGCVAYNNADDGWDLYAKIGTGEIGAVTIRNCIAFENGFVPGAGSKTGNGNGFKMGGESIPGQHVLENCIAFNNLMKGIDSNSCPDIIVRDCVSFNNGSHNVALYTNNANNTAFVVDGVISFRTEGLDIAENLKGKGTQNGSDYINETAYYWDEVTGVCKNNRGQTITADMFVSLEYTGWTRNADGTINLNGFLEIKDTVPQNASNCKLLGMASKEIVLLEDEACSFGRAWFVLDKDAHWHYCECGNKSQIAPHDFIWIYDKQVQGNLPGLKHEECTICGYQKAGITIYPQPPVEDNEDQTPADPVIPDDDTNEEPVKELSFFEKIWQAIVNFFRKLFGMEPVAFRPLTRYLI